MKRRDFIVSSGSAILTGGIGLSKIQKPAVGVEFEVSVPDKDPSKVDSLMVYFENLNLTPRYLDETQGMTVQAEIDVEGTTKKSEEKVMSITNGETEKLGNQIKPITVDIKNQSIVSGEVIVTVNHPDIQDNYIQSFNVTPQNIEIFTQPGSSKTWDVSSSVDNVTVLAVVGGGAGAYPGHSGRGAGGGGAGGLVFVPNYDVSNDDQLNVYVGRGGNGAENGSNTYRNKDPVKYAGENTEFGEITALGGGAGGHGHYSGWS